MTCPSPLGDAGSYYDGTVLSLLRLEVSSPRDRRVSAALAALVALVAFLPFARGVFRGETFYFRDLGRQFFPERAFVLEGLRVGELRFWNPLVHEGEPLLLPPVAYPLDLLQVLSPGPAGLTLSLALHLPLAALGFTLLTRRLGLSPLAGAGGALVYALGGFALSSVNLYLYVQALAWAPLVVLALREAALGGPRAWAFGGLVTAVALSTGGVEVVAQAMLMAVVIVAGRVPARFGRLAVAIVLGAALCGPTLLVMGAQLGGSARAAGFSVRQALGFSVHPVTLLQVVVAGLLGDPANLVDRFWGVRFFEAMPYFLSLYLGCLALAFAVLGLRFAPRLGARIALLVGLALLVSLGRYARLDLLIEAVPAFRAFRYPAKAFFTVHLGVALLAALGVHALGQPGRRAWSWLTVTAGAAGGLLVAAPLLPRLLPATTSRLLQVLVADFSAPARYQQARFVLWDAFMGGLLAAAGGLIAALVLTRKLKPQLGGLAVVSLLAIDLLRAGAGLNPTARPSFFDLSPEMAGATRRLRQEGGRVFSCDPELGEAYWQARRRYPGSAEVWTSAVLMETLTPYFNLPYHVSTAYGRDLKMVIPEHRILPPKLAGCKDFAAIAEGLREAGVAHVVSLDPLKHERLRLREVLEPRRLAPVAIYVYDLDQPLPLRFVASQVVPVADRDSAERVAAQPGFQEAGSVAVEAGLEIAPGVRGSVEASSERSGRIELQVESDGESVVVLREAYAPGWRAFVDGREVPLLRADGRHRAVAIPAGRSHVVLSYWPPGLVGGLVGLALGGVAVVLLWRRGDPRKG